MVSQAESENSACLDRTSDASQSSRYLTIEREVVNTLFTAQVQSDLNKLSTEAAVEHYSIPVDKCDNSEIYVYTQFEKRKFDIVTPLYRL